MRESRFQGELIKTLRWMFPDCVILKNDASYLQGVPDVLILFNDRWAMLEVKASANAHRQPNQDYYNELFNKMSFAAFICPENEEEVLHALQQSFGSRRTARLSKRL